LRWSFEDPGHRPIVKRRANSTFARGRLPHLRPRRGVRRADRGPQCAARAIGEGFYGVDIKQTDSGFIVIEVNDNPNLEHGIEDQIGKDEVWTKVLKWFSELFEQ
jgi:hypothetical protein